MSESAFASDKPERFEGKAETESRSKPVVFVLGTTASGKSQWALDWAQQFGGAVVNCDSVQLYKSLNIGAAKPTPDEMKLAPHLLYDYVNEGETMTAGKYTRDFFPCMEAMPAMPAFVVGGTGFYFQAIEKGMYPVHQIPEQIRAQVAACLSTPEGALKLYEQFRTTDPEAAQKIHAQDHYRLGRAMELILAEGKSITAIRSEFASTQKPFPYPLLKIGIKWERSALEERVRRRTIGMIEAGLIEEVSGLLDRGLASWAPLTGVGYSEAGQFIRGGRTREWLIEEITKNTMGIAKRQRTWFQRDPEVCWFDGATGFTDATERVKAFLQAGKS
ncbi:MAG: tRNA (adenosine(37)-N6)-dimethylallyltransferase MiaA [Proteobacteria bacterium]|nr:MAG: tRNA (adenosine(37)-N6)-dimethylallyltransferase MiaA [Pseudomonadota bacterium]